MQFCYICNFWPPKLRAPLAKSWIRISIFCTCVHSCSLMTTPETLGQLNEFLVCFYPTWQLYKLCFGICPLKISTLAKALVQATNEQLVPMKLSPLNNTVWKPAIYTKLEQFKGANSCIVCMVNVAALLAYQCGLVEKAHSTYHTVI